MPAGPVESLAPGKAGRPLRQRAAGKAVSPKFDLTP
jgi:hypothetical protein